jgi:serine/threonine protein kinase
VQGNILVTDEGSARLADIGLTRVAGELNTVASAMPSTTGASAGRWSPRERLDPERFGSKGSSRPTKKSDIYSMAMTIYEVSILRCRSGQAIDVVPGSDGQNPVLRVQ